MALYPELVIKSSSFNKYTKSTQSVPEPSANHPFPMETWQAESQILEGKIYLATW